MPFLRMRTLVNSASLVVFATFFPAFARAQEVVDKVDVHNANSAARSESSTTDPESTPEPVPSPDADATAPASASKTGETPAKPQQSADPTSLTEREESTANSGEKPAAEAKPPESVNSAPPPPEPPEPEAEPAPSAEPPKPKAHHQHGAKSSRDRRTGLTIIPRIGLTVGGWSRFEVKCDTQGALDCGDEQFPDASDAAAFQLGLDGLYHILPSLRLGVAASWLPMTRGSVGGQLRSLGSELALQGALEGVADVSKSLALVGRLQVGASALIPSDYIDDLVDQSEQDCDAAAAAGIFCEVSHGVTPALTYGASVGLLWQLPETRLRLDVGYRMQSVTVLTQDASDGSGSVDAKLMMHQSRVVLTAGVEL